jgi:hypothetical protein
MLRASGTLCLIGLLTMGAVPSAAQSEDPLMEARVLYNQRDFDRAIAAAEAARELPGQADAADLVAARAFLERYRESAEAEDLTSARERLRRIGAERLGPRERSEYTVGIGATLYFEGSAGAAADVFASILEDGTLGSDAREGVLDWWASSIDRDARPRLEAERRGIYQTLRDRMRVEVGANPASTVAAYWLAAAAAGQGDWDAAWGSAQAAWVRAPFMADHGVLLRADVDRLVREAIAPERARARAEPPDALLAAWETFKEKWTR